MSSGDEFDDHYATQRRRQASAAPAKAAAATETAVPWVDDAEAPACHVCETPFSLVKRRHHCRTCGNVICSSCSVFVPTAKKPQRVCITCVEGVQPQRKAAAPSQLPAAAKKEPRTTNRAQADVVAPSTRPPPPVPDAHSSHRLQESIDNWFLDENEPVSPMASMPVPEKARRTSAPSSSAWASVGPATSKAKPQSNLRFADVVFDDRPLYDDDVDDSRSLSRFPLPKTQPHYDNRQADRHVHRASVPSLVQPPSPSPQRSSVAVVVPPRAHEPAPRAMAAPAPVSPPLAPSTAPEKKKHGFRATMKRLFGGKEASEGSAPPPLTTVPLPSTRASVSVSVSVSAASSTSTSDALSASKVSLDASEKVSSRSNDEASQSHASSAYANPSMLSLRPSTSSSSLVSKEASAPVTRPRRDTFEDMFEGPRHVQPLRDLQTRAFDIPSTEKPTTRETRRGTLEDVAFGSPPTTSASSLYGAYASVPGASRYGHDRFALPERSNRYAHAEPQRTTAVDFDLDDDDDTKRHQAEFDPVSGTYIVPQKALVVRQPTSEVSRQPTAVGGPAMSETTGIAIVNKLSSLEHELAELKSLLAARKSHRRSNAASIFEQESESDPDAAVSPPIVKKKKSKREPRAPRKDSFGDLFEDDEASGKQQYESLFAIQGRRDLKEDKDNEDDDEEGDAPVSRWPGRHKPRRGRSPVPQVATKKASNRRFTMDDSDSASSPPRKPKRKDSFDGLFTEASPYKEELFGDNVASSDDDERVENRTTSKRLQHIYGSDGDVPMATEDDAALPSLKRKIKAPATALIEAKASTPVQPAQVTKPVAKPRMRKDSIDNLFQDDARKFDQLFVDKPRPGTVTKNLFDGSSDEDDVAAPLAAPQPLTFDSIPSNVDNDDDEDDLPSLRAAKRPAPTPTLAPAVAVAESHFSDEEELPSLRSRPSTVPASTTLPDPAPVPLLDLAAQTQRLTDGSLPITSDVTLGMLDMVTDLETVQIAPLVVEAAPTVAEFSLPPSQASGFVIDLDEEFDDGLFGAATVRVAAPLTTTSAQESAESAAALASTATNAASMWLFDEDSGRSSTSSFAPVVATGKPQDEPSVSLFDEASYVRIEAADVHSSPEMVGVATDAAVPPLESNFESFFSSPEPPSSVVDISMDDDAAAVDGDDDPTPDADAFSFERKPTKKRATAVAPVLVHRPSKPFGVDEDNDGGILLGQDATPPTNAVPLEPDDVDVLAKVDNAEFDASWQAMQQDEKARKQNVLKRQRQLQKQKLKDAAEKKAAEKEKKPKASKKKHDRSTTK
ncbi:hypothetical protein, variant [Saprolegnia diclina VS20]|uniref:FYVE-type domain-containing protein n=1 Tax=Saprolegnia diclina (strain VS20) TaxID=1156394 RepID=T0S836_SAPDV|nr:hypothetical protein, variant [Saprolegnia diclina VS20]EQC41378.1 hypothetical protein, variant [Saprolegnia diclina VS20]|eukprot:XP_008605092.1 hypothetical protein, variant [Saprolegnia diclina VS20]